MLAHEMTHVLRQIIHDPAVFKECKLCYYNSCQKRNWLILIGGHCSLSLELLHKGCNVYDKMWILCRCQDKAILSFQVMKGGTEDTQIRPSTDSDELYKKNKIV